MLKDVLIKLRIDHNYSQEFVALNCNVSRQAVSKWERGLSVPDIYNCQELCKLYDVNINDLLEADANDYKYVSPNNKYIFGYVRVNEDRTIKLSEDCLNKMNINIDDILICLGDTERGIALVKPLEYENFAEVIMKTKGGFKDGNN